MSVKLTAIVAGTLFVSTMTAKILMNVCKEEDHVPWVQSVVTYLEDTSAVVLLVWMGIHMLKDADKCVKNAEGTRIASQ